MKTIADARGPEVDQGELLRYLGEAVWYPSAFLSDNIAWEAVDEHSAKSTIHYGGKSADGIFHFDDEGRITRFVADRYYDADGDYRLEKWSATVDSYDLVNGYMIPRTGEVIWHLSEGDFPYFRGEVVEIEYNLPAAY